MLKLVKVKAEDEKEALKKGIKKLANSNSIVITKNDVNIQLIEEKNGFLGFGGGDNLYLITLNEEDLEDEIEHAVKDIAIDGEYKLKINDKGIFLKVTPPEGGEKVSYQEIKQELDKKKIEELDLAVIKEVLERANDKFLKIAERKPELDVDGEVSVLISKNVLKAYLNYVPARGGRKISLSDINKVITNAGIKYGIKRDKIKAILKSGELKENILIAEGDPAVEGRDAEYNYHFKQSVESIGTKRKDGSIDYYNLARIQNVSPGDVLITIKEPQPGKPGRGVTGEKIPPRQLRSIDLPSGKNVEARDEKTLVASIGGQVVQDGKKIHVLPIHEVNGDIDLSTGNIDFVGNVKVNGNVLEGFKIMAGGNVEIKGNAAGAIIESGGDVVIHKGYIGKEKGYIKAQGDVCIRFIENGRVEADNQIIVDNAVMHSDLTAGDSVEIKNGKGLLVGGIVRATREIEANIIGSSLGTQTRLEVGIDPEIKRRIKELEEEIDENKKNHLKTNKAIKLLKKMKESKGKLPKDKEIMFYKLIKTQKRLEESNEDKGEELKGLEEKVSNMSRGKVVVNKKIFPGVKLLISRSQFNVHETINRTAFIEEQGEIKKLNI